MDQALFNWLLALLGAAFGAILTVLWNAVKDLQLSDKQLVEKIGSIDKLIAGSYVPREEFRQLTTAIFSKLDRIEDKLDKKVDRS